MRKYELVNQHDGVNLHQIRALIDIPRFGIKTGDLGGWVADEKNLSQEGDCWIQLGSVVLGEARVTAHGLVKSGIRVSGDVLITGYAIIRNCIDGSRKSLYWE